MLNTTKQQKQVSENPYYGLKSMLLLLQQLPKMVNASSAQVDNLLTNALSEVNSITDVGRKEEAKILLYTIIFKAGDIVNREHNMFGKRKVDGGGDSLRKTFRYCLAWMLKNDKQTFYKLLPLVPEYTNFENIMFYQITTDRYKGNVIEVEKLEIDHNYLTDYLVALLTSTKTSDFQKALIAKFLPPVPTSKRYKRTKTGEILAREKQGITKIKDDVMLSFISLLSKKMGWQTVQHKRNLKYDGYCAFRSKYLASTEAHLFSTKKIIDFDKVQFLEWLEGLPSGARHRVQCRICEKDGTSLKAKTKWMAKTGFNLGEVYIQWLRDKEVALKQLISLSEEDKKSMDPTKLRNLTKQAKINTGAETLMDNVLDFFSGGDTATMNLKANSILEKVKLEVPVLCIIDCSGSMSTQQNFTNNVRMSARQVATLALTTFLSKTPDEDLKGMFMLFGSNAYVIADGRNDALLPGVNRYTGGNSTQVDGLLCDPRKTFVENYSTLTNIINVRNEGSTNISSVPTKLKAWVDEDPALTNMRIESIQRFPVWLIISDGDMNNGYNATASMADFQMKMLQWFGASPVIVVWDVKAPNAYGSNDSKYENLENVMYFGGFNYAILNQVFMNINDLDIIDVFTPLLALSRSDRYQPIRDQLTN